MYLRVISYCLRGFHRQRSSRADDYIEWVAANSGVNWTNGSAVAEGAGLAKPGTPPSLAKMMACRAALVDGQRNLLESLQGVRVEGITIVDNLMLESDSDQIERRGLLKRRGDDQSTPPSRWHLRSDVDGTDCWKLCA